jgi:hypothetical protein
MQPSSSGMSQQYIDPTLLAALNNLQIPSTHACHMDSGASSHMASDYGNFDSVTPSPPSQFITVGNCSTIPITHIGSYALTSTSIPLHLRNILIVPQLSKIQSLFANLLLITPILSNFLWFLYEGSYHQDRDSSMQ